MSVGWSKLANARKFFITWSTRNLKERSDSCVNGCKYCTYCPLLSLWHKNMVSQAINAVSRLCKYGNAIGPVRSAGI